jgi:hypothetical protein
MKILKCFFSIAAAIMLIISVSSCNGCESKNQTLTDKDLILGDSQINDQLMDDFNKSKLIFYSLPSPLETATLIKKTGASYDVDLLNNVDNVTKYNTNLKMALNLGIFSSDMSYSGLFDQMQTTLQYMNATRKLAESLGILGAVEENTIKKLEQNLNNRDIVIEIISETFMNSNAYLTENDRPAIMVMVLTGGWMEGLYIATQLAKGSIDANKELIDRIIYQKLSLQTVINLLETHKNNSDIDYLISKMYELKEIYDDIQIVQKSSIETETIPDQKMTIIRSDAETLITPEIFKLLIEKVLTIRNEFVS